MERRNTRTDFAEHDHDVGDNPDVHDGAGVGAAGPGEGCCGGGRGEREDGYWCSASRDSQQLRGDVGERLCKYLEMLRGQVR